MHALIHEFAGKYARFILPAYGLSALALVWMTTDTILSARRWKKAAEAREALRREGETGASE